MNATPSSSQPAPMRTDRGDLPSPMRTKTVERDIPIRSFTTGPRTVLIAMGRLLPSRSLRPKKHTHGLPARPSCHQCCGALGLPEGTPNKGDPPHAENFLEGPYRRPQPPRRAGEHVRSDRSGHGLAPAPAANPGGHSGIRQAAVTAARHSVEPCTPALMDYRSGHRCGPGTVRGFQGRCDVGLAIENRPLVVGTASPVAVSYPDRCLYGSGPGQGRPMEHGAQQTNKAKKTGGSRSASRCPIPPGRRRPRHRRTPPTAGALSSGEDGKKAARSDRGRCR